MEEIIDANKNNYETNEQEVRPSYFDDFIGQNHAKENLKIFIEAARSRNEPLDHVILYGPPGLGKTTIAQIISKEMSTGFKSTSGPLLTKSGDLAAILTNLEANDVLFIDEIHRLSTNVEEVLYTAMEDFKLDIIIGEGPAARSIRIDLEKFTLIGATTRLGLLSNPLIDRFGIPTKLDFYTPPQLQKVIERCAGIFKVNINSAASLEIAHRSRGTPRIAIRLLKRIRDFAYFEDKNLVDKDLASRSLNKLGVDTLGLDQSDLKYLKFIAEKYGGGPVGIETISAGLSEKKDSIEETIEPYLIQTGLIARTSRGRVLTSNSFKHLGLKQLTNNNKNDLFD